MRAMVKTQAYLDTLNARKGSKGYHIVMNVHDEIVLDFPQKKGRGNLPIVNRVRKLLESIGPDVGVVLTCGANYHQSNWSKKG